jgi:hypothetical protein
MKTPILGSSYVARSVNAADSRMVNLFPEIVPEGGKEAAWLQRAPGLRKITTVGDGPIRGLWQFGGFAYVASGNYLYQLNSNWESTQIGELVGSSPVSMSDNGTQLFVACNPNGYIYNTSTRTFFTLTINFPGAVTVGFLDGFFVFNQPNSQKLWVTDLYDGTTIDPLNFASAEGSPDNVVSIIVDHRELWVFGTNSTEVWYNAGTAGFPFAPIQGAFNEIGCAAAYSVAKLDNTLFWLGSDARGRGIVYRAQGYKGVRVSTHAVEWQIQQYSDMADAIGYTYQQDGHIFYVLIFPTANTTWVYDASTEVWHERAGWDNSAFVRHRSNCQMSFNDEIVVGDYENGNIYAFDLDKYDDDGSTQKWLRSWRALPTGQNNLKRTAQHSLQLDCETGVGLQGVDFFDQLNELATETAAFLTTESGENILVQVPYVVGAKPEVMLRWSDDGGHTWSNERWVSMGRIGRFGQRAIWRRLGMTQKIRDRVYEISATDPVKIAIMGAELILSPTNA